MIRVANVIEEGRLGGPQIRIAEVANRLQHLNIKTTVIYPDRESEAFTKLLNRYGIDALPRHINRLTRQKAHLLRYILMFPLEIVELWKHFKTEKYDLIHCSGGCWQFKALLAAKLAGVPALWHLNDTGMPLPLRVLFKFLARFCPAALIVAADRVRQYYVRDMQVHNLHIYELQAPVDTTRFTRGKIEPLAAITNTPGLSVVTVCSVNPDKDIENLLRAATIVAQTQSDIHFHIVGPVHSSQAGYKSKLDDIIKQNSLTNVTFHNPLSDVREALEAADIYVCSSVREASPLSVWEAMSMACPVASTDVGDVARFLKHNEGGLIVRPGAPQALAQGILALADNPTLRKRFGANARTIVKANLDVEIIAKQHAEAYRDLLQRLIKH